MRFTLVLLVLVLSAPVAAEWDPDFSFRMLPATSQVFELGIFQGDLIAGGSFTSLGGATSRGIARFDGQRWHSMGAGIENQAFPDQAYVETMAVYDGKLFVGGSFDHMDGRPMAHIAQWDGTSWSPVGTGADDRVSALTIFRGKLVVGGFFTSAGGEPNTLKIARWDGQGWSSMGSIFDFGGLILNMDVYRGNLITAGLFLRLNTVVVHHIAESDGDAWFGIGGGFHGGFPVTTMGSVFVYDGDLYAGGQFERAGNVVANGVARFDGARWHSLGAFDGDSHLVAGLDMAEYQGDLFVGGSFREIDRLSHHHIARWDGSRWHTLGAGLDSWARALVVYAGDLIVGGDFGMAGGHLAPRLARWRGQTVPVRVLSFLATRERGLALVRGHLESGGGAEATLHLHRSVGGSVPVRLTETPIQAAGEFSFWDAAPPAAGAEYWLEELRPGEDVSLWHGPASLSAARPAMALRVPNPLRSGSSLRYELPRAASILLTVHDVRGRVVASLDQGIRAAGHHGLPWRGVDDGGRALVAGTYFVRLAADGLERTRKITIER